MTETTSQRKIQPNPPAKTSRGGRLARSFYRFTYRHGSPRWDSDEPHTELKAFVDGRPAGRALDLGCGTGTDVIFLAQHGWDAVGIDFAPEAIEEAKRRASAAGASPKFVVGDVTNLRQAGVDGPFDLVIDTGCFHGIAASLRDAYAEEVAAVAAPGADFFVAGISDPPATWRLLGARGVDAQDLHRHFDADFELAEERDAAGRGRMSHFVLFHLVRRDADQTSTVSALESGAYPCLAWPDRPCPISPGRPSVAVSG